MEPTQKQAVVQIFGVQHSLGQVCIKFVANGREVSLAFDDNCRGAMPTRFIRHSLCIFDGEKNITPTVFQGDCELNGFDIDDLIKALQHIKGA